jgi:hypothetical protein
VPTFDIFVHAASNPATSQESQSSGSSLSFGTGKGNMSDTFTVQGVPQVMMVVLGFHSLLVPEGKIR